MAADRMAELEAEKVYPYQGVDSIDDVDAERAAFIAGASWRGNQAFTIHAPAPPAMRGAPCPTCGRRG